MFERYDRRGYFVWSMNKAFVPLVLLAICIFSLGCRQEAAQEATGVEFEPKTSVEKPTPSPTIPPTLAEIEDSKNTSSESPLADFDFKNYTYPLPRGWQDADSKTIELIDGERRMTSEKIGMSFITTKFGDVNEDDEDEAIVILRVGTGGSANPHLVYVFENKDGKPEIAWFFRTGDRSDGGLKRVYAENGNLVIELFGQDRYIFNQMETLKIIGDEPQLCCPTHYTKNVYKRSPSGFRLEGDRMTYSLEKPDTEPLANLGDERLKESRGKK